MFVLLFLRVCFGVVCVVLMFFVKFLLSIRRFCLRTVMFIRCNIFIALGFTLGLVSTFGAFCAVSGADISPFICRGLAQFLGHRKFFDIFVEKVFYLLEIMLVAWTYEGYGLAIGSSSCCASYAVDIVFDVAWDIEIDDEGYVVYVDATCYDICCYEYVRLP